MKNKWMKITATIVCVGLVAGLTGHGAYAALQGKQKASKTEKTTVSKEVESDTKEASKDETVYVFSEADGKIKNIVVSDWLKQTHGDDLYTKKDSQKELPVKMSVEYELDGKKISPKELAGKSGHVTIRFSFENQQFEEKTIQGKTERIYVPFTVLTGMILDNEKFHNVEISSGKLLNDGERLIAAGVAFPGLQDNLKIDEDKLDLPDTVELTADVTEFEMGMTITVATTEPFSDPDADPEKLDLGELSDSMEKMTSAMTQLMDGSAALYDGLCTLLEKSNELVDGIDQLSAGAGELRNGAKALNDGASKLQSGAGALSDGLNTLNANSGALNDGATQVFQSLLSMADAQLAQAGVQTGGLTIENYEGVLNGIIGSLDENAVYEAALQKVTAKVNENRGMITEKVTEVVRQQVETAVALQVEEAVKATVEQKVRENEPQIKAAVINKVLGISPEEYEVGIEAGQITEEAQASINEAVEGVILQKIDEQMKSEEVGAQIQAITAQKLEEQMQSEEIQATIASNVEAQVQKAVSDAMNSEEVQSQLGAAAEGAKSIISLKTSLDSYKAFYMGLKTYTAGVASAAAGAGELKSGTDTLKSGTGTLYEGTGKLSDGIGKMKEGAPALIDGVTKLRDGSLELSNGLKQFNEEGIQKLADLVDGDLKGLTDRFDATIDAAKSYTSFEDTKETQDGNVKFIYKTEEIR